MSRRLAGTSHFLADDQPQHGSEADQDDHGHDDGASDDQVLGLCQEAPKVLARLFYNGYAFGPR